MINREWQTVQILTYTTTTDSYGQKRTSTPTSTNAEMVCKIYNQNNVQDPRYVDVEMLGLTKASINTSNEIIINSTKYIVMYTIPSGKYLQVLMRKK